MPEPVRWTQNDDAATNAARGMGRASRHAPGDDATATVHVVRWWQHSAIRHPITRFLLIFVPLAGLWFGWKYHDASPAPAAPAIPPAMTAPVAAPDTTASPPPSPAWQEPAEAHLSDEARRSALLAKEAAWRAWYRRPERCEQPATAEIEIECATHYLEHAREFEARYRAGTLPTSGAE